MRLTWSLSRCDAQSLGCSVIPPLGDVDREKGRKTRDIKRGRNLRKENQPLGLLYAGYQSLLVFSSVTRKVYRGGAVHICCSGNIVVLRL